MASAGKKDVISKDNNLSIRPMRLNLACLVEVVEVAKEIRPGSACSCIMGEMMQPSGRWVLVVKMARNRRWPQR